MWPTSLPPTKDSADTVTAGTLGGTDANLLTLATNSAPSFTSTQDFKNPLVCASGDANAYEFTVIATSGSVDRDPGPCHPHRSAYVLSPGGGRGRLETKLNRQIAAHDLRQVVNRSQPNVNRARYFTLANPKRRTTKGRCNSCSRTPPKMAIRPTNSAHHSRCFPHQLNTVTGVTLFTAVTLAKARGPRITRCELPQKSTFSGKRSRMARTENTSAELERGRTSAADSSLTLKTTHLWYA